MKARLIGGLATAAVVGAGLVFPATATAAAVTGYPHDLGFVPSKLIATDDAVYAVGVDSDTAYVAVVGAEGGPTAMTTGAETYTVDAALAPDGSTLRLVTVDDDGTHYWDVDADDLDVTADGSPAPDENVEALGTDAGGIFEVRDVSEQGVVLATADGSVQLTESDSTDSASIGAAAARGPVGDRTWYVAGTDFADETATLWTYDEATETVGDPVELGAAGDPDAFVESLAVDEDADVAYALSWRNNDDAPQSFGITAVQDGPDTYLPLRYRAQDIALSPDGETLYLASNDSVLALATDRLADYDDESDADGVYVDSYVSALAVDGQGTVFAGSDGSLVHAFSVPDAPADLTLAPDPMSTDGFSARWDEGAYSWERDEDDPIRYDYTVRDADGVVVASDRTWDQTVTVAELAAGATYTFEVTASNGLITGPSTTEQVTTYGRYVAAPSTVSVQGSLTVGSVLSLASAGTWESGTTLTYEWYGSNGEMGGAIGSGPTLTLTADHVGLTITGVVTGTHPDAAGVTLWASTAGTVANPPAVTPPAVTPPVATPAPVTPAPAPAAPIKLKSSEPTVDGKAKVGKTLTAEAGSWTKGAKLTYQWLANGKEIKGATKAKLKLTKALKGKKISVEVTGSKTGYTTVSKTSDQTAKVKR